MANPLTMTRKDETFIKSNDSLLQEIRARKFKRNQQKEHLDPEAIKWAHSLFRATLQGFDHGHAISTFINNYTNLDPSFAQPPLPLNPTLIGKFTDAATAVVQAAFVTALAGTTTPMEKFKQEVEAISALFKDDPREFSNEDLAKNLENKKEVALKALKEQQKKEMDSLKALFTPTLNPALAGLNLSADELATYKQEMINKLTARHEEQNVAINKVESEIQTGITVLNDLRKNYDNEVIVAANLKFGSENMKEAIRKKINENTPLTALVDNDADNPDRTTVSLKGIKLSELEDKDGKPFFETFRGRKVTTNPDGSLSIHVSRWHNVWGSIDRHETKMIVEWTNLAQELKARGVEKITFTARSDNPENALRLARVQAEAGARAGFDLSNITMMVTKEKGKGPEKIDMRELLGKDYARIEAIANAHKKRREEFTGPPKSTDKDIQEKINSAITAKMAAPAVAPVAGAGPGA